MEPVLGPWASLSDEALKVPSHEKYDKYHLTAPWAKDGNDRKAESEMNQKTVDARVKRREENAIRDKRFRALSMDLARKSYDERRKFRGREIAEQRELEQLQKRARDGSIRDLCENLKQLRTSKVLEESKEQEQARVAAKDALQRKNRLVARQRREEAEMREVARKESEARRESHRIYKTGVRKAAGEYSRTVSEEIRRRRRAAAARSRQERLERETISRQLREAHKHRKQVRAAWVEEEGAAAQQNPHRSERKSALKAEEKRNEYEERLCREKELVRSRENWRKIQMTERADRRQQEAERISEIESVVESRHMKALERKRAGEEEFYDRNQRPLQQRSKFSQEQRATARREERARQESIQQERAARMERRRALREREKAIQQCPFALG